MCAHQVVNDARFAGQLKGDGVGGKGGHMAIDAVGAGGMFSGCDLAVDGGGVALATRRGVAAFGF